MKTGFISTENVKEHGSESEGLEAIGEGVYLTTNIKYAGDFASPKNTGDKSNAIIEVEFFGRVYNITEFDVDEFSSSMNPCNTEVFICQKRSEGFIALRLGNEYNVFDVEALNRMPRRII